MLFRSLRFNVADGKLECKGSFNASTQFAVYNMGGVKVASATASHDCDSVMLDVEELPHGSYIVVVKDATAARVYKIVL